MIRAMKQRLLAILLACTLSFSAPIVAFAGDDEAPPKIDARLEGYKEGDMGLKSASGVAINYILLIVLMAMCIGVLFINPKRTHLD